MSDVTVGQLVGVLTLRDLLSPTIKAAGANVERLGAQIEETADIAGKFGGEMGEKFDETTKRVRETSSALDEMGSTLGGAAPALAGVFAGIASLTAITYETVKTLKNWTEGLIEAGSKLDDLRTKTEVNVGALQEWKFAGNDVGVSADTIATAATKMSRLIGEGSKRAQEAVHALHLSFTDLKNAEPDKQFNTIISALHDIDNVSEQTALAKRLGISGETLKLVRMDFDEARIKAHEFGAVMDDETVAAADNLGDAMGRLDEAWEGFKNQIASFIIQNPEIANAFDQLGVLLGTTVDFLRDNKDAAGLLLDQLGGAQLTGFIEGVRMLTKELESAKSDFETTKMAAEEFFKFGMGVGEEGSMELPIPKTRRDIRTPGSASIEMMTQDQALKLANQGLDAAIKRTEQQIKTAAEKAQHARDAFTDKWWRDQEAFDSRQEAESAKMSHFWDSLAGPGAAEVEDQVKRIGDSIREHLADGAELSTEQLGRLAKKVQDLKAISPEGFKKAEQFLPQDVDLGVFQTLKMAPAKMQEAAGKLISGTDVHLQQTVKYTQDWNRALEVTDHLMSVLGISADSTMGHILGGLSAGMAGFQNLQHSMGGKGLSGLFQMKDADGAATGKMSVGSVLGGMSTALQAAGAALTIGKAIFSMFHKSPAEKAAEAAGKDLGFKVSKELGEAMAASMKKLHVDLKGAELLNLDKLMAESGKSAGTFVPQIKELITSIASGSIPARQGMEQLDKTFAALSEEAKKSKLASLDLFNVMKQARASGVMSDSMKAALTATVEAFGPQVEKAFGKLGDVAADTGEKIKGAVGGLMIMTPEAAEHQATIFGFVWGQTVAEKGLVEAARILGPGFEALQSRLAQHSEGFAEAARAILAPIAQDMVLATNAAFAAASDGALGFADILKSAINTAMPMTIQQFQAFGGVATDAFEQAKQGAIETGLTTEEAQRAALTTIAPLLQQLVQGAEAYGFELDGSTQALIEQAKQQGIAFATSPIDRAASAMERVAGALEKVYGLTTATAGAMGGLASAANGVNVGGLEHMPKQLGEIPGFASGGRVSANPPLGTLIRVGERVGETIISPDSASSSAVQSGGDMYHYELNFNIDGSNDPRSTADAVIAALRDFPGFAAAVRGA